MEKKPRKLSKQEKDEIIEKCRDHPRLKYFIHVTHPIGIYEKFKRYIFPGFKCLDSCILIGIIFKACIDVVASFTFLLIVCTSFCSAVDYIYWI
jgi:hypothetical protein